VQKSAEEVLASIFWNQDGILLIDYLPKGQTFNAKYYSSLLVQLKETLKEKRRGKVTKGVLFLHDNVPTHWALATRRYWPTWASNVLITHFILQIWPRRNTTCFLEKKKKIERPPFFVRRGGHFAAAETWLNGQPSEFLLSCLQKFEKRAKKCTELRGEYVE